MIGKGTFGQVYKADYENPFTGEKKKIALKKLNMFRATDGFPITAIREILLLKELKHNNIVELQDVFHSRQAKSNEYRGS